MVTFAKTTVTPPINDILCIYNEMEANFSAIWFNYYVVHCIYDC